MHRTTPTTSFPPSKRNHACVPLTRENNHKNKRRKRSSARLTRNDNNNSVAFGCNQPTQPKGNGRRTRTVHPHACQRPKREKSRSSGYTTHQHKRCVWKDQGKKGEPKVSQQTNRSSRRSKTETRQVETRRQRSKRRSCAERKVRCHFETSENTCQETRTNVQSDREQACKVRPEKIQDPTREGDPRGFA